MARIYVPDSVPSSYKYITNITNTYFDIYNVSNTSNTSGVFYRVYYGLDDDIIEQRTFNNSAYGGTNTILIDRTNDFLARHYSSNIVSTSFFIIIFIVFLANLMTSIIRKGGVFGDLL